MPATSNSVFFTVIAVPPAENVGWEVRVLDHASLNLLAVVAEFNELSIGPELSAPGAGSITVNLDSPFWSTQLTDGQPATTLLDYQHVWQAYEDGILRYEFLGRQVEETLLDDDESHVVTISGPGGGDVLRWAKIFPPGFPDPPPPLTSDHLTDNEMLPGWGFPLDWPAMRMWWSLFTSAQQRGTITFVTPMFTETADSGGVPWEIIPLLGTRNDAAYNIALGTDLLEFLNDCTAQDTSKWFAMYAEWVMRPGFRLDVRKSIGVHREDQVIFFEAAIKQKQVTRVRDDIANLVVVRDVLGQLSVATDPASMARWNQREQLQTATAQVTDDARRNTLSQLFLEQTHEQKSQWVIQVPYNQPGRRPFRDYDIGDWIGVDMFNPTGPSTVDAYRVLAIVVHVDSSGATTVELTLQSKLEARQKQLEQLITRVINTNTGAPGTIPGGPTIPQVPLIPNGDGTFSPDPNWANTGVGDIFNRGTGVKVFIQDTDPGDKALPGDFWFNTAYTPEPDFPYQPDPLPDFEETQNGGRQRVPGTNVWFE